MVQYIGRPQSFLLQFTETKPNLMERFIWTDTVSVELFNIFTSRVETFVIPGDKLLYHCVSEVCRLELEQLYDTHLRISDILDD